MAFSVSSTKRGGRGYRKILIVKLVTAIVITVVFVAGVVSTIDAIEEEVQATVERGNERARVTMTQLDAVNQLFAGEVTRDAGDFAPRPDIGILGYSLRTSDGEQVWSTFDHHHDVSEMSDIFTADPEGGAIDRVQVRLVWIKAEDGSNQLVAHIAMPILRDGVLVGWLEKVTDETKLRAVMAEETIETLTMMVILYVVALGSIIINAVLIVREHEAASHIYHLAHHDPLTGVANRNRCLARLDRALAKRTSSSGVAFHIIDVDGFKSINDTFGHDAGDELLRTIAGRITDCIGPEDDVARLGGDEFALVQRGVTGPDDARRVAEQMVEAARAVSDLHGVPVSVSLSIGYALAPEHATLATELQKCADAALYRAKSEGRDRFVEFADGMDGELKTRNMLRVMLRRSLEIEAFQLHYQPLHASCTGALLGFEALLRMPDGNGGFVSPAQFIPVAEDMGLTPRIGQWVLNEACRAATQWPGDLSVAVNLSAQQFREDLVSVVEGALSLSGLSPSRLEVEITESLFISEPESVADQLHRLKEMGVRVVMDDFGTGYSSLSYLWKFPFDKLKVDRSCFMSLEESSNVGEVLRTISAMSDAMKLRIVAEGIETEVQREFACSAGYDELQGYLCSKPMPLEAVADYVQSSPMLTPEADESAPTRPNMLN